MFFFLDGPSFQELGPAQQYALFNESLSLVYGTGFDSNPQAIVTWTAPDGTTVMDDTRFKLENGSDTVRLNFTRTILSDSGVWTCELVVRSERHVVSNQGQLLLAGQAVIGTPLRRQFMLTVIGEFEFMPVLRPYSELDAVFAFSIIECINSTKLFMLLSHISMINNMLFINRAISNCAMLLVLFHPFTPT